MFLKNVINSDERLGKKIINGQKQISGENWTNETELIGIKYDIDMNKITEMKKYE